MNKFRRKHFRERRSHNFDEFRTLSEMDQEEFPTDAFVHFSSTILLMPCSKDTVTVAESAHKLFVINGISLQII